MADLYAIVTLRVSGDQVLYNIAHDRPESELAGWFTTAMSELPLPLPTCLAYVGPRPVIHRAPALVGGEIYVQWLVQVYESCYVAPVSVPTPDSPVRSQAEFQAQAWEDIRQLGANIYTAAHDGVTGWNTNFISSPVVGVIATPYSPAANGSLLSWTSGLAAQASPSQDSSSLLHAWQGDVAGAVVQIGNTVSHIVNPIINTASSWAKDIIIWGAVAAFVVVAAPPAYRYFRDRNANTQRARKNPYLAAGDPVAALFTPR